MNSTYDNRLERMLDITAHIAERLLSLRDAQPQPFPSDFQLQVVELLQLSLEPLEEQPKPREEVVETQNAEERVIPESQQEPRLTPQDDAIEAKDATEKRENDSKEQTPLETASIVEPKQPEISAVSASISSVEPSPAQLLRKMFTISDIYLFRRELFNNSDAEFNDALGRIANTSSMDEAREYLLYALGLDAKKEETQMFLSQLEALFEQ